MPILFGIGLPDEIGQRLELGFDPRPPDVLVAGRGRGAALQSRSTPRPGPLSRKMRTLVPEEYRAGRGTMVKYSGSSLYSRLMTSHMSIPARRMRAGRTVVEARLHPGVGLVGLLAEGQDLEPGRRGRAVRSRGRKGEGECRQDDERGGERRNNFSAHDLSSIYRISNSESGGRR